MELVGRRLPQCGVLASAKWLAPMLGELSAREVAAHPGARLAIVALNIALTESGGVILAEAPGPVFVPQRPRIDGGSLRH